MALLGAPVDVFAWTDPGPGPFRRILARSLLINHQVIGFTVLCDNEDDYRAAVGENNHTLAITG
ncbi:hypothetical protein KNO15_21985 [Leifsonia shinshuensis]|uniref:hypothetical protein n=1 Tax=Leifsonia shinshuensis TaxID=150026 RepID=UPI001F504914|nr:hypothetical protein [Leifsonia shinshuensis]MCI0159381.1 hypothetical protein [Leifsonia shinshuensis]